MQIVRELTGDELIFTAVCMLIGKAGKDFAYYEQGPAWWQLRLWISRN